jgi:soluble lytic murein transglycosylase-like protein
MVASRASADTLYLKAGTALKIEALSCDATACVASIRGGSVEVRAMDVDRVEADEPVDVEPVPATAPRERGVIAPRTVEELVSDAASRYGLPKSLVRAVARAESAFDPDAISAKGARGVMQLMPGTAKELGVEDAFDPGQNIDAGARLLRQLLEKYEGRVAEALAAYNAGQGAVAKHNGVPPYRETRGYIRRVVKEFEQAEKPGAAAKGASKRP